MFYESDKKVFVNLKTSNNFYDTQKLRSIRKQICYYFLKFECDPQKKIDSLLCYVLNTFHAHFTHEYI